MPRKHKASPAPVSSRLFGSGLVVVALGLLLYGEFGNLREFDVWSAIAAHEFVSTFTDSAEYHQIAFVGDVFLGRDVETKLGLYGASFPFLDDRLPAGTIGVANFESPAPDKHTKTPDETLSFSTKQAYLPVLAEFGYRYLSLANNHSLDKGQAGLRQTITAMAAANLQPFGAGTAPSWVAIPLPESVLGVAGFNTVTATVTPESIAAMLYEMTLVTDHQIAYIHWGAEYESVHTPEQERLAQLLIESGFEAVIGHHPHVVQDIAWYQGSPIFYSLGNYIFDQYFEQSVQQGLRLEVAATDSVLTYRLVPVTSEATLIQPQPMTGEQKAEFLRLLLEKSDPLLPAFYSHGVITQQI